MKFDPHLSNSPRGEDEGLNNSGRTEIVQGQLQIEPCAAEMLLLFFVI